MAATLKQAQAIAPPAPLCIRLSRARLSIFATLATIEQRPLDEVIAECMADMAAHLSRARQSLRLNEADRVSLERYLDSLERDEEERTAREGTTSAMRAVAAASDAREAFPHVIDDEHEDFLLRTARSGYMELALAMET